MEGLFRERPSEAFFITDERAAARKLLFDWSMTLASQRNGLDVKVYPTAQEQHAILRACQELGRYDAELVPLLPRSATAERAVYAYYKESVDAELEPWLRRNTQHLQAKLIEAARTDEEDLRVLARRDWERAERLIEELQTSPALPVKINGAAVLFERTGDRLALEELLNVAYDAEAPVPVRDVAVRSLLARPWDGRDDCFLRLLGDKSLSDVPRERSQEFPLLVVRDTPDHWIPVLARALEAKGTLRDHAIRVLVGIPRAEALLPPLPRLQDQEWVGSRSWTAFVRQLREVEVPGAEGALLQAMARLESPGARAQVAESLAHYPSPDHIPLLVEALRAEESPAYRKSYVRALLGHDYFSIQDQVQATLAFARQGEFFNVPDEPVRSDQVLLGELLLGVGNRKSLLSTDRLIKAEISLISTLSAEDRRTMERVLLRQGGPLVERYLIDSLKSGTPSSLVLTALLEQPETFRSKYSQELFALSNSTGTVGGIAAAVAERDASSILAGEDKEAQKALLASARITGARLPVRQVGQLLQGPTKEAAEAYLMAVDNEQARRELLASSSEKPVVFGRAGFYFEGISPAWESELEGYLRAHPDVRDIYCVLTTGYYEAYGNFIVLVRDDDVELRHSLESDSYEGRHLTAKERKDFLGFVVEAKLDVPYPPPGFDHSFSIYGGHGPHFEFLHLNRQQGRRQSFIPLRAPFGELFERLRTLSEVEMQPHNLLLESEPGATVVFDGNSEKVATRLREWNGRIYLGFAPPDTGSGFRSIYTGNRISEHSESEWRELVGSRLVELKAAPWKEQEKKDHVGAAPLVGDGVRSFVTSPDGRLRALENQLSDSEKSLYRSQVVELDTGRTHSSELAPAAICAPVLYLEAHGAFLVFRSEEIAAEHAGRFYLLKPDGTCAEANGDLAPCLDALTQPLQQRGQDQYWVATSNEVETRIGIFDATTLRFQERAVYPNLGITSSQIWVDESGRVVYVVVGGDLMKVPLPGK